MLKLLIANWKAYPATEAEAVVLARATDYAGMIICPPHEFMREVGAVLKYAILGGQDYAPDLAERGARYAIIGHSNRRAQGDTDDIIAEKIALTAGDGLIPILCVGEMAKELAQGERERIIRQQVVTGISRLDAFPNTLLYIAYEPVWAISTTPGAREETPEDAADCIAYIKEVVMQRGYRGMVYYLYGGSVTALNARKFITHAQIDGLLVGEASVREKEIYIIWQEFQK